MFRFFELNAARLRSDSPEQFSQKDTFFSKNSKTISASQSYDKDKSSTRLELFLSKEKHNIMEKEYNASQVFLIIIF
jgi:uncharacterized phage-like protein YoqJ